MLQKYDQMCAVNISRNIATNRYFQNLISQKFYYVPHNSPQFFTSNDNFQIQGSNEKLTAL